MKNKKITVTEKERAFLKVIVEKRRDAEVAFEIASKNIRNARNEIWMTLHEFYPEIEKYHTNYNCDTGEISVIGKKESGEDKQ